MIADDWKGCAPWRRCRLRGCRSSRSLDASTAAIVVLAVTVAAHDAQRLTVAVDDDDRVEAICFAGAAVVLEGLTGPEDAGCWHFSFEKARKS